MQEAPVVVVGGGLAGLAVAASLAPHRRVIVVERGGIGAEASAQNAGMLRRMGEDPYERALAIRTHARLLGEDDLAPAARRTGAVLAFGRDPHHLHDAAAHLRWAGVEHVWRERFDDVPALAGSPLLGGWWVPGACVVDAWTLLQALRARMRAHGAEVVTGEVVEVPHPDGRVAGVVLADGRAIEGEVVVATGAWSGPLGRLAGVRRPLVPLRRSLMLTGPHPASRPDHPWCWVDDEGVYARPEGEGWLVSGCDEAVDPAPPGGGSRGPLEAEPRALALAKLERWFPALATAEPTTGWSGLRTFAPDRRPVLGADPERAGLWWCAGLGGFGVSCGLAAGEAVAAWIRGTTVDFLQPRGVSPGRPMLRRWMIRPTGDLARATAVEVER